MSVFVFGSVCRAIIYFYPEDFFQRRVNKFREVILGGRSEMVQLFPTPDGHIYQTGQTQFVQVMGDNGPAS
jgi:hypothetical protein